MDDWTTDLCIGRNSGRISRTQHSPNDIEPSFHNSPTTSTGGTRRLRGFQPSEVNVNKPPEAPAVLREPVPPIKAIGTEAVPSKSSPVNNGPLAKAENSSIQVTSTEAVPPKPNLVNDELLTKSGENGYSSIQATATPATHPKINPVNVEPITKPGENRNSSLQLTIPEEKREFKPSFWSKVPSHAEGATPGWDSSEQDLNQPSWKNIDAIVPAYAQAPKRANMANLPPYKFPRKKPENPAAASFNRQMAGIEKGPVPHLREIPSSVNAGAMSAIRYNSRKDETHPAKDNSPETKNLASEQGSAVKVPPPIEVMSTRVPPHLRGPSHLSQSKDVPTEGLKPSKAADEQPESHFTTTVESLKIKDPHAVVSAEDLTGKTTIAAALNYEVPSRLQVTRFHKSRTTEKVKSMTLSSGNHKDNDAYQNVNIDDEVAAGLNAIDNDEELAVALQDEWSAGQEFTQQDQSHGFGTSRPQAHTLQMKKSAGAKNTDRAPDNTSGATKQQESQEEALAPHLRILVTTTTTTTSEPIKEPSNVLVEPSSAEKSRSKTTTLVGTRSEGLKNITNSGEVKQVHSGGAIAKTAKSTVKAGKQPARKDNLLHGNADLVNWDGTLAPPLQGEDWANREAFGGSNRDRKSLIEAWREEHATEAEVTGGVKIDTKSLEFQTGKALIGGNGDVLSFIDDSDHKAIPNDDGFTQLHREQSAAAAIEQYKAETASQQKPTKSGESGESKGTGQLERRNIKRIIREEEEYLNTLSREHAPKANIYLRPAESGDMRQCTEIYNQWALDSAFTTTLGPVNTAYWIECYNSSRDDKLPFLVAIHTGKKRWNWVKDVRRTNRETIIGFSVATSYGSSSTVYRYSVELELYVHREHLRQGVGRTILDRMLGATCQDYKIIDCAPLLLTKGHRLVEWIGGGVSDVHTVAVNLIHWAGEDHDNVEWKMKWLSGDRNLFEHVGTLPKIGYKFVKPYAFSRQVFGNSYTNRDSSVNNCLMVRDAGSILEPR